MTNKQLARRIENQKYYARNAEKIKAHKREMYQKSIPKKESPARKKMNTSYRNPNKPPDKDIIEKLKPAINREKLKIRRKIEDWKLAKELEIDSF